MNYKIRTIVKIVIKVNASRFNFNFEKCILTENSAFGNNYNATNNLMNPNLSEEQIHFLKNQNIPLHLVFNAFGMSKSEYRVIMKELNKLVAFNVTPCKKSGHTLRTRSGHCCQCNTATLAYQKRNDSAGIVYVAGSKSGSIMKIGFSKAMEVRSKSLIRTKYAGQSDWEILYAIKSKNAGTIDTKVYSLMNKYSLEFEYNHDGEWHDSHKTYHCSYSKCKELVLKAANDHSFEIIHNIQSSDYEFQNLIKSNVK